MQALILAGGFGTRLRPLTLTTPKPVVPLVNRPILAYQIELLKRAGIRDIILSLNYQPTKIQEIIGDGTMYGVSIRYVTEPSPLGTAGAVKYAESFISETTIILNGDNLINLDLAEVAEFHRKNKALATIVSMTVENPVGYGLIEIGENDRILAFREKPTAAELEKTDIRTVNAGTYIFEPEVMNFIPAHGPASFEYDVFPKLLLQERPFKAFISDDSYWIDVGNPPRYLQAHADIINGRVDGFTGNDERTSGSISATADVGQNSIIGRASTIGENVRIENSVLGSNVAVMDGAQIIDSVIGAGTRIGSYADIRGAIVAGDCVIGNNAKVKVGNVLGKDSVLTDYSQV